VRFKDRVALVTGGGRGIGAATAQLLASEGAKVAVSDLDEGPAREVAGPISGLAIACDVSDRGQVEKLVDRTVKEFGRLDILVTCAGIIRDNLLFKMSDDDWDAVIDTHLKGTFLCARGPEAHGRAEVRKDGLPFVDLALGNRGQANYSAAKAGLAGDGEDARHRAGAFNVNVNTSLRLRRDAHDARHRRADGSGLRSFQVGGRLADPAAAGRPA